MFVELTLSLKGEPKTGIWVPVIYGGNAFWGEPLRKDVKQEKGKRQEGREKEPSSIKSGLGLILDWPKSSFGF